MSLGRNPYSSALGLEDLDLRSLIASGKLSYRAAIMAALVEHGAPLSLEDIARRVYDLGMGETRAALLRSLRKAWGGSQALRKLKDGRVSLDVNAPDAVFLRTQVSRFMEERRPPPLVGPVVSDAQPLSESELREGLPGAYLHPLSGAMLGAIVTEATGRPMDVSEINGYLARLGAEFRPLGDDPRRGAARSPLVVLDTRDRLQVNPDAPNLPALRARVRKLAQRARAERATETRVRASLEERQRERRGARAEVLARRRRLLHAYEVGGSPILVGHVDPVGTNPAAFATPSSKDAEWLPDCDVLIGLDIFELVDRLGVDPGHRRLVDLGPPQKTKSVGPHRPPLKLTTVRLLRHTLGTWARLAAKSRIRQLARRRDQAGLHQAMQADLETLAAYYWYGVRHGFLYALWSDPDMQVPAPFAETGDARMAEVLDDLVGHGVWMRLRAERMSDAPEEIAGIVTHASWLSFTIETKEFRLQGPLGAVLGVHRLSEA